MLADSYMIWREQLINWAGPRCADPEELAQEVLVRAWLAERTGKEIRRGYVFSAAYNLWIDRWRHDARVGELYDQAARFPDPAAGLECERLLSLMRPNQAAAIRLQAAGYSMLEIGMQLGISANAVKHLVLRGRRAARAAA